MALALDGSGTGHSTGGAITISLTTTSDNDVIIVALSETPGVAPPVPSVSSTPALTWTQRRTYNSPSSASSLIEYYAVWSSHGSLSITVTPDGGETGAAAVAFGVSGAETTSPFDSTGQVEKNGSNTIPASALESTSNANHFILD